MTNWAAWISGSTPMWILTAGYLLLYVVFARTWVSMWQERKTNAARAVVEQIHPSLRFSARTVNPERMVMLAFSATIVSTLGVGLLIDPIVSMFVGLPIGAVTIWLGESLGRNSYTQKLEKALVAEVGRLESFLGRNVSLPQAMRQITENIPDGPLRQEWGFLLMKTGQARGDGSLFVMPEVIDALQRQTLSSRHRTFLAALSVAIKQEQRVQHRRIGAMYVALLASEQRLSAIKTQLDQIKSTGFLIGGIAVGIFLYISVIQADLFVNAFSSDYGLIAGIVLGGTLLSPILGGIWLSHIEDVTY